MAGADVIAHARSKDVFLKNNEVSWGLLVGDRDPIYSGKMGAAEGL